jgi:hypothetical protein
MEEKFRYYACVEDQSKASFTCQLVDTPSNTPSTVRICGYVSTFFDPLLLSQKLKAPVTILPLK